MTDDEAFIRAIVAAPADEAPRLVYADWLDERDDPRGAYMRDEVKLFHVAKGPIDQKSSREFRAGWKGLDQVWAARVSRLPVGVCCDLIHFSHSGPQVDAPALDRIQSNLRVKLPPTYRAFLMNYNGGMPEPKRFQTTGNPTPELAVRFYPASEDSTPSGPSQRYHGNLIQATDFLYSGRHAPPRPRRMIPIMAATYPVSILIGVLGARLGCIYRCFEPQLETNWDPLKVADSLPTFLLSFRSQ